MTPPKQRPPAWFTIVVLVMMIPIFFYIPLVIGMFDTPGTFEPNTKGFVTLFFPIYALLSVWLAYQCYPERKEISWILLGLLFIFYVYGAISQFIIGSTIP
ncbi:hypothetical protein [Muribaculum intestinale]|jgi:hypothetical protein|uniref:hypothetical protein n=1 Tax=Muribaculum intestinale TaxID=1796646 RepID=UPI0014350C93|nr:hypothetical protein [Muribaculum intestinale]GFI67225.1 hypothetical protein IMSAG192_00750 [Muribaculaceae bacterium]